VIAAVLALGAAPLLSGCGDSGGGGEPKSRAEVIPGGSAQPTTIGTPAWTATAPTPPIVRKPRKLCTQKPAMDGKPLAEVKFGHVEATGETALGDALETGKGLWTWVNLWAGWCGPCKEEMPMLRQWESLLKTKLRVDFVSVDEDPRLSVRFLNTQPAGGLRATHHLAEGDAKKQWLESAGIGEISKLPMHILVDPEGAIRCVITGEVDAADFDQVKAFIGAN